MNGEMDERKARILRAIINDYLETAEPVGSRTVSRKYETALSSATIRNEMSDLEELGYLAQPHVSAGRVPSHSAYRLYVDELMEKVPVFDEEAARCFRSCYEQVDDAPTAAVQALSDYTRCTAAVMLPKQEELRISCLQLVPMPRGAALLVIITDTGAVRDTVIRVSERLDGDALYAISRSLTERLSGHTLQEVQQLFGAYARSPGTDGQVMEGIAGLASQMARQMSQDTVIVSGMHNILNYPEYANVEKARAFLNVLENKDRLKPVISPGGGSCRVFIGAETGIPEFSDCTVITADYRVGRGHYGTLSVIGPVRIPYGKIIASLKTVGNLLSGMSGE